LTQGVFAQQSGFRDVISVNDQVLLGFVGYGFCRDEGSSVDRVPGCCEWSSVNVVHGFSSGVNDVHGDDSGWFAGRGCREC
jgi:hypothetical protein